MEPGGIAPRLAFVWKRLKSTFIIITTPSLLACIPEKKRQTPADKSPAGVKLLKKTRRERKWTYSERLQFCLTPMARWSSYSKMPKVHRSAKRVGERPREEFDGSLVSGRRRWQEEEDEEMMEEDEDDANMDAEGEVDEEELEDDHEEYLNSCEFRWLNAKAID
ncbi:unnamed protein product [Rodentolepis nana]|uniref:Uncharacterized protein n=1 Tax=Rodentolepis nana TaxID=102285 RepID=A0A0R3TN42_RODNA|nr:unnamed protein product [Rodentolepis nana]